MRLLIVTQKVDSDSPILGFFVRWLRELSACYAEITVIAQEVGAYDLPGNVRVVSLGKERGVPTLLQVVRAWRTVWQLRHDYDAAFVHMTPIWIVLQAPLWLIAKKPMYLWYESRGRRWPLWVALLFVKKIFSATPLSLPVFAHKNIVTNHGIDTEFWTPAGGKDESLIVTMGRVSKVKRLEYIIDCFAALPSTMRLMIVGGPFIAEDLPYYQSIERMINDKRLYERVSMHFLSSDEVRTVLRKASLYLHASSGTLDKSVLQAMASGTAVVSCCPATEGIVPSECQASPEELSVVAARLLEDAARREALAIECRQIAEMRHSLSSLAARFRAEMLPPEQPFRLWRAFLCGCLLLTGCTMADDGNRATIECEFHFAEHESHTPLSELPS